MNQSNFFSTTRNENQATTDEENRCDNENIFSCIFVNMQ